MQLIARRNSAAFEAAGISDSPVRPGPALERRKQKDPSSLPTCPHVPINFTPRWGAILICNFECAHIPPEMRKIRRVIVLSSTQHNTWSALNPGTCTVVPLSSTVPWSRDLRAVLIPRGTYPSLTRDVWAKCGMVQTISNARLSRVRIGQRYLKDFATQADMARVQDATRFALDL